MCGVNNLHGPHSDFQCRKYNRTNMDLGVRKYSACPRKSGVGPKKLRICGLDSLHGARCEYECRKSNKTKYGQGCPEIH